MKTPSSPKYSQDEKGQWWYTGSNGERSKCRINICPQCGDEFPVSVYHHRRQVCCSHTCARHRRIDHPETIKTKAIGAKGEKSARWKSGRIINRNGYVMIWKPDHHSIKPGTFRKYVPEHRLVMEEKLGRPLDPKERVHHLDGNRQNNDPTNLELWKIGHPAGQREHEQKHCPTCTCHQSSVA